MKNKNDDSLRGVIFLIVFAVAMILWVMFKDQDKSYLYDPYLPDEGAHECITSPSGDCL